MRSLHLIAALTLALGLGACGGDDADDADTTTEPSDCDAVGAQQKSRITALGCSDTSATIAAGCRALYAAKMCTSQWEALLACITPKPNTDFECDADDELAPKTGICTAERAAFDGCIGN